MPRSESVTRSSCSLTRTTRWAIVDRAPSGARASASCCTLRDVDAVFERAISAGGKALRPLADQFYGDRMGTLEDPFGHVWTLGTHIEDVSPEEMKRRMAAAHA